MAAAARRQIIVGGEPIIKSLSAQSSTWNLNFSLRGFAAFCYYSHNNLFVDLKLYNCEI